MSEQFVLATHNPAKLREMREILSELGVEVVSPEEIGVTVDVEETGTTFAENAMLKAKALCEQTGLPAIGDDSGLCVDVLNGGPGVYSARYGGESISDAARNNLLLESVKGQGRRDAHFTCSIACAFPNGDTLTAEEHCYGVISYIPMGTGGFGYDPVFNYPPKLKTFAQMTPEEKSEVSHRGKALRSFAETLGAYLSERAWNEIEEEKRRAAGDVPEEAAETAEAVPEEPQTPENPETVPESPETVAEESEAVDAAETVSEEAETVETAPEVPENVPEEAETVEAAPEATGNTAEEPETVENAEENPETVSPGAQTPTHHHHKKKKHKKHH